MLERIVIVAAFLAVVLAVSLTMRAAGRLRMARVTGTLLPDEWQTRFPVGPAILYFYGPHCGTCRQQAAILDQLSRENSIDVWRVDATAEPELADALAVMTVPTTVIVDGAKQVRSVNAGLRSFESLVTQLQEVQPPILSLT